MADEVVTPAVTPTPAAEAPKEESVLSTADQPIVSEKETVLDISDAEEKAQQAAEEKRLTEAKVEDLTPDEQAKRASILKAKAEADTKVAEEARAKGVPEKYELKPPEGFTLDDALMAKVTPVFKAAGLTQAQAQAMVDYHAVWQKEQMAANESVFKNWNEANVKETMASLGANAKTELQYVAKVKNMLSPETIEALNASGIGNLKHFITDMAKVGRLFSEEHLVNDKTTRKPPAQGSTSEEVAEKFYPSMTQK